ncbi:hypothetical protein V493_07912, partial [Pseudogymnoascus sp. VKM F-4281 (FW-2241)]
MHASRITDRPAEGAAAVCSQIGSDAGTAGGRSGYIDALCASLVGCRWVWMVVSESFCRAVVNARRLPHLVRTPSRDPCRARGLKRRDGRQGGGDDESRYEEASVYTTPNTEQKPNFGDNIPPRGDALAAQQKRDRERAEHRDENKRYGEAITEHGFGGTTVGSSHSTTTSATTKTTGGSGVGGGGGDGGVSSMGEEQQHRHGSYETSPEVEEREARERKWQG